MRGRFLAGWGDIAYKDVVTPGWEVKDAGKAIPKQLLKWGVGVKA